MPRAKKRESKGWLTYFEAAFTLSFKTGILWLCEGGSNSVVECHPSKVDVAGSNPVSRSI